MKLSETHTIWGIPVSSLKERAKVYKRWIAVMYGFDILVISIITAYLFRRAQSFWWYALAIVIFAVLCNIVITVVSNASKYEAFKFYRKMRNCTVEECQYSITVEQLYSVLYCMGYKRLKPERSFHEYCEAIFSMCCEDAYNSKKVMKYLDKYKVTDDGAITLKCLILKHRKRYYLVDILFQAD